MGELPSEATRLLAHRLTVAIGPFTRGHAFAAASVTPTVSMPGESLDVLVGPWVERVGSDTYRVSPLLEGAAKETLPALEVAAINEALALYPFTKGKVTAAEVGTAFLHGLLAQSKKALAQHVHFLLTTNFESVPGVAEALFVLPGMALGPGQRLFRGDAALEVMLRVVQFKTASATKRHDAVGAVIDRTLDAIPHVKKSVRPHIASLAYGSFLSNVTVPIPPERSISMLAAFMRIPDQDARIASAIRNYETTGRAFPSSLSGLSPFQTLFYFEAARMDGVDALDALLTQVATLSPADRAHLIRVFDDETYSSLIVNNAWHGDVKKKRLDAERAVAICERARTLAAKWGGRALGRAASVAVAVLHDEYRNDAASALAALDRATAEFGPQDGRVLLGRGKVLYGRKDWNPAIAAFEAGLRDQTVDPVDRVFGMRLLGVSAANAGDWARAASAFHQASAAARAHHELLGRMAVGLKADAAYAIWKQREVREALRLYAEVLRELEQVPVDRDLRNRHLHATVRHAVAWIWGYECDRRPPPDMAEPMPGMCSNQDPHERMAELEIRDLDAIWPLLVATDERVSAGLQLAEVARKRRVGPAPVIVQAAERGAALDALREGRGLAEAPRSIVRFVESVVAQGDDKRAAWEKKDIGPLAEGYWEDDARRNQLMRLLLAVGVIAAAEGVAIPADQWRKQLIEAGGLTTLADRFLALLADPAEPSDGTLFQEAASSLARIQKGGLSPKALFQCHFRLLNAVEGGDSEYLAGDAFAKLALAWREVAQNQRSALVIPNENCPIIEQRCKSFTRPGLPKVAGILDAAAPAAGVRLAPNAKAFLKRLMEQPEPRAPIGSEGP